MHSSLSSQWSWKGSRILLTVNTISTPFSGLAAGSEAAITSLRSILDTGNIIRLDRGDSLVVHPSENGHVVTLEYEVHGKVLATGTPYDSRLVSIVTIENRKIVRWRDYMDSLAAWTALNKPA